MNYLKYYYLEDYLFRKIRNNFQKRSYLVPEEFFCIVIWKANRAKTRIKSRILEKNGNLAKNIRKLTHRIYQASDKEEKLRILLDDWRFRLPIATAILTVLYPDDFTVYDERVREQLGLKDFSGRKNQIENYFLKFLTKVRKQPGKNLRDKDRYLWGKSFYEGLKKFLQNKGFDDFRRKANRETRILLEELDKRICLIDQNIKREYRQDYIKYGINRRGFFDIFVRRRNLKIEVRREALSADTKRRFKEYSNNRWPSWRWMDIRNEQELDYAFKVIKESYKITKVL